MYLNTLTHGETAQQREPFERDQIDQDARIRRCGKCGAF